jgi:protoheme IX farnesyltransferase
MSGIVFYVLIYTHILKRHSTQNIVIGGAAGAVPALVGWAAVTGTLSWAGWLIFAIVFLWTPPHFWSLALMIRDDYAKVGVPMLPVVAGTAPTVRQIWFYTLITVAATFLLVYPLQVSGIVYGTIALCLGGVFIYKAWQLLQNPEERSLAKGLFLYSISYMMLLCLGMVIDSLPITHHVIDVVVDKAHLLIG